MPNPLPEPAQGANLTMDWRSARSLPTRAPRAMLIDLPASLDRNVQTLDREVMDARAMTPEERLRCVALACRAAMDLLAFNAHREHILASQDPLPASSVLLLARLRERELAGAKMPVRA